MFSLAGLVEYLLHTTPPPNFFPLATDLLLLLWPVFFVAATRQNPHLKVRNFRKSVTRGSQHILNFSKPVRVSVSARHRRELARRIGRKTAAGLGEEKPAWDFGDAIPLDQVSAVAIFANKIHVKFARAIVRC